MPLAGCSGCRYVSDVLKSAAHRDFCFANFLKDNDIFKEAMKEEVVVEKKTVDHCTIVECS